MQAALALREAVGYGRGEPWLELGVGLHAGIAYVGNVGGPGVQDMTALGDTVNTAARLQKAAAGGEIVLSQSLWESVEAPPPAETRTLDLKGKEGPFAARVVGAVHA